MVKKIIEIDICSLVSYTITVAFFGVDISFKNCLFQEEGAEEQLAKGLVILTDDNFHSKVAKGQSFIKFFAPWCGHCKKIAPVWDELAERYQDDDDVMIAKVTNLVFLCIKYYPVLKIRINKK